MVETVRDTGDLQSKEVLGDNFSVEVVEIAGVRGPCAGVNSALETTFEVLNIVNGREKVYANHQIVHNKLISDELKKLGLVIEEDIEKIPDGAIRITSAHGRTKADKLRAKDKGFLDIETTCRLVENVADAAIEAVGEGKHVLYFGAENHPEPKAVLSRLPRDSFTFIDHDTEIEAPILTKKVKIYGEHGVEIGEERVLFESLQDFVSLNQTTLSTVGIMKKIEQLREANPHLDIPNPTGICYAADNRQNAIRERLRNDNEEKIDMVIIGGTYKVSHNTTEMGNITEEEEFKKLGVGSHVIDTPDQIDPTWLTPDIKRLLISSGASVLDEYLWEIVRYFTDRGAKVKFLPNSETKPVIDPETGEPKINPETGEIIYKKAIFPKPDLTALHERYMN